MTSLQLCVRMERLAGARAPGPTRSGARRKGDHRHRSRPKRGLATLAERLHPVVRRIHRQPDHILRQDILDLRVGPEAVLGEPNPAFLQVGPDLLVLRPVERILRPAS